MANKLSGAGWFLMVPESVARDSRLSRMQQNVYSELYTFQNATPNQALWISNGALAERYGSTADSISKAISKLVKLGYLKREVIYKENSKEIERRLLWVVPPVEMDKGVPSKHTGGYRSDELGGTVEMVEENIPSNIPVNKPMNGITSSYDKHDQTLSSSTKQLLDKINELSGRKFRLTDSSKRLVKPRLADYSLEELLEMLDYKWKDWEDWDGRYKAFQPETLFRAKNTDKYIASMQAKPIKQESDPDDWLAQVTEAADNA